MASTKHSNQPIRISTNLGLGIIATTLTLAAISVALWLDILLPLLVFVLAIMVGTAFLAVLWRSPATLLIIYIILLPAYILTIAALYKFSGSTTLVTLFRP